MSADALTRKRVLKVCGVLAGALVALGFLALAVGAAAIPPLDIVAALWQAVTGRSEALTTEHRLILFEIRLPRILLAAIVGAALAVAGAAYQALLRNPLADPYVLGVSSGAALGTILALALGPHTPLATPPAAFLGAVATIAAVYFLGQRGAELNPHTLLLAGVITASFLSAVISLLMSFLAGPALRGAAFWLLGDLSNPSPVGLGWLALGLGAALVAIYSVAGDLNLLLAGETEAETLGVDVRRTKRIVYLAASWATGLAVSVSGAIGYVGLLVPHVVRLAVGGDYRLLVPATAFGGALALLAADTLARTILAPSELPVGAVTAVVGAPVFIYLLRRGLAGGGGRWSA